MMKILIAVVVVLAFAMVGRAIYQKTEKISTLTLEVSNLSAQLKQEKEQHAKDIETTKACDEPRALQEARQSNDSLTAIPTPVQALQDPPKQEQPSEESKMESAVRAQLKDPDSAKFGKLIVIDGKMACLPVNSRNSFGGYTGEKYFVMKQSNDGGGWVIDPQITQGEFGDNLCRLSLMSKK